MTLLHESSIGAEVALKEVIDASLGLLATELGNRVVSVVHFGSTAVSPVKFEADIDIMIIVDALPEYDPRGLEVSSALKRRLEPSLDRLRAMGRTYRWALLVRTKTQASRFSKHYLDMVDQSRVLSDESGFFASLLSRTQAWITSAGAKRTKTGGKTYWDLGDEKKAMAIWDAVKLK